MADPEGPVSRSVLPFSWIVGQDDCKLALQLSYIEPRLGGVLLSGKRGTAKSTVVRSFALLAWERLPITLPINATEDRVIGGWKIEQLLESKPDWQPGLLEEANGTMLYVDEVNLLDDHIVNLLLDVASTNILVVQREGRRSQKEVHFSLVGTMNPEEGALRPQLLDRFGLMVGVEAETTRRAEIVRRRLQFEDALAGGSNTSAGEELRKAELDTATLRRELVDARKRVGQLKPDMDVVDRCVELAKRFEVEGHRAELMLALAARAYAAWRGSTTTFAAEHVKPVAALALQHRRKEAAGGGRPVWTSRDTEVIEEVCT